jgi:hypothetical protein
MMPDQEVKKLSAFLRKLLKKKHIVTKSRILECVTRLEKTHFLRMEDINWILPFLQRIQPVDQIDSRDKVQNYLSGFLHPEEASPNTLEEFLIDEYKA